MILWFYYIELYQQEVALNGLFKTRQIAYSAFQHMIPKQ